MLSTLRINREHRSPILEAQQMPGKARKRNVFRELALALPLTSLIDAFSIIVIYLLIGTQSGSFEVKVGPVQLPTADHSMSVDKEIPVLRIQKKEFYINDQKIASSQLQQKLVDLKKNSKEKDVEIMVQADQNMSFDELDPLIKAGSLAGIEKFRFAVITTK